MRRKCGRYKFVQPHYDANGRPSGGQSDRRARVGRLAAEGREGRLRWKAPLRATSAPMDDAAAATADDEDEDVGHGRDHHHMSIWREERRRNKESQFRRQNITLGRRRMPHRKWI